MALAWDSYKCGEIKLVDGIPLSHCRFRFMVFNSTFNNISVISWLSVLLVEETEVPIENHRPAASHWQTLSHNDVSSTPHHEQGSNSPTLVVIDTDCTSSYKSNYHSIETTTPLQTVGKQNLTIKY
jgi:hypothetical protein